MGVRWALCISPLWPPWMQIVSIPGLVPSIISRLVIFAVKLKVRMKESLLLLAQYNLWANKRMVACLMKLPSEIVDREVISSFPSLKETAYHSWGAEDIWLQRLLLKEKPVWAPKLFTGTFEQGCEEWLNTSAALEQFVQRQYDQRALEHIIQYYNLKKQSFKSPAYVILQHAFNHSTYHRGQLVTLLRQAGVARIPETDIMVFRS
ncbi:MAG: hypothetical protein EOP50_02635 [Sphingobacteriales bacterium]|nr:MAG: hypothetical protein EOP50_02635 [Sphingobacteriales bacterium]